MKRSAIFAAVFLAATLLAACAANPRSSTYRIAEVDVAPKLLHCPRHQPPGARGGHTLWVEYLVLPDGTVAPGSVVRVNQGRGTADPDVFARVRTAAESCIYQPALKDGQPVAARVEWHFEVTRAS